MLTCSLRRVDKTVAKVPDQIIVAKPDVKDKNGDTEAKQAGKVNQKTGVYNSEPNVEGLEIDDDVKT